jgi:hypothetical protein
MYFVGLRNVRSNENGRYEQYTSKMASICISVPLQRRSIWDLRSSGMLGNVDW